MQRKELRRELDPAKATDILWALCGAEAYSLFVQRRGWPPQAFGDWLYGTLIPGGRVSVRRTQA